MRAPLLSWAGDREKAQWHGAAYRPTHRGACYRAASYAPSHRGSRHAPNAWRVFEACRQGVAGAASHFFYICQQLQQGPKEPGQDLGHRVHSAFLAAKGRRVHACARTFAHLLHFFRQGIL